MGSQVESPWIDSPDTNKLEFVDSANSNVTFRPPIQRSGDPGNSHKFYQVRSTCHLWRFRTGMSARNIFLIKKPFPSHTGTWTFMIEDRVVLKNKYRKKILSITSRLSY